MHKSNPLSCLFGNHEHYDNKHFSRLATLLGAVSLLISSAGISRAQVNATGDIDPTTFSGATWNLGGSNLLIGSTGAGNMTIAPGGSVSNTNGSIGTFATSTGRVDVSGGNWTNSGLFYVGQYGNGTLVMSGPGVISAGNGTTIATVNGSTGVANISAGLLTAGPLLYVGDGGTGTLNLSGSGVVTATTSAVGVFAGSTGLAQVSGGNWTTTGEFFIGYESNGTVDLSGNASVTALQVRMGAEVNGNGNLTLHGGVLTTGQVEENKGNGTVTFNGGTLRLSGNQTNLFSGFETGDVRLVGPGGGTIDTQSFNVATALGLTGNGSMTKQGNGTLTLTGNNSFTGDTNVESGTLRVGAGGSINSADLVSVGNVSGQTGSLVVENGGTVNNFLTSIGRSGGNGTATVSGNGSRWTTTNNLYVGNTGNGSLTVQNGALVESVGGSFFIGYQESGQVLVTGAGSRMASNFATQLGSDSTGILTLEDGGEFSAYAIQIGADSGSGTINIGTGGTAGILSLAGGFIDGTGTGTINFNHTGNVTFSHKILGNISVSKLGNGTTQLNGNNTFNGGVTVAGGTLSLGSNTAAGTGTITTTGSVIDYVNGVTIANPILLNSNDTQLQVLTGSATQQGNITETGGARPLEKIGDGALNLTGTNTYTGDTIVRGGTLTLNSGGSITHTSANLTVGEADGESATVSVGSNGSLSAFRGFLGYDAGASGLLSIADGNATFADELYVGYTGNGTLELSGNGTLSNTKAFIGVNSPSVSSANITGGVWTNSGELTVGYGGRGSLAISGNGSVTSAGAFFGFLAASNGNNATITGPGASWTSTGAFYMGHDGSDNALEVLSGGSLISGGSDFLIGANLGSGNNSLTVRGNGSTFTNNATLYVGRSGVGNSMVVEDGAAVISRNVRIGGGTGSNGTTSDNFVRVSGANSTWTIGGTLRVGSNGDNSTLTISNGASVGVTGNSFLGYDAVSDGNAVSVSGNGSKWTVNALTIGRLGTNNTVTVSEGGNLTATTVTIADQGGSSGTLRIGNGTAAGYVSANQITGGNGTARVEFNHSDSNLEFAPLLSGSLSVQHGGTGTTAFSVANTYSGGTTIQSGTVRTENASALGSGGVTFDSGTLDPVGQLDISTLTWNGGTVASGLGTATDYVNLSGNLTLGGGGGGFTFTDNAGFAPNTTYTILSAANMADSLLGLFSGNSLLGLSPTFSRSGADLLVNFAGSSTGPLLQNVGGPWTPTTADFVVNGPARTGNATASNTVNSLLFNPGSSLQVLNNLTVSGGRFNVAGGSASLFGGNVITPGDFNKVGDGNLIANSNFQVGGAANIQSGGLFVNGQFITPGGLTVFQNALLGGSGVIVGNVFNNGIVNPGNSPGTLTINGNFSQSSSGTLQIEIASPSVFDRLIVSGAANLDGTLQILNLGKRLKYGQRYAFLQAGSINGEFDQILMPQPGTFRGRFLAEGGLGSLVVAPTSYTLVAETPNQRRVAKALDSYISARSGDREVVSIALDIQSEEQYPYAFEQIAPGFYESLTEITIGQAFAQTQMINQRLSSVRLGASGFQAIGFDEQPLRHDKDGKSVADAKDFKSEITNLTSPAWAAWAMGTGIFAKAQGLSGVPNYRYQAGGFLAGADYAFGERGRSEVPSMTAGIYGGYNYTYAKYSGGSSMQVNSALFGLYGTYAHGGFYADAVVGGGYNGYKANRSIQFSTVDRTARSSPAGGQFNAAINLGYDWKVAGFTFGPIAGLQYTYAGVSSFTEQGADSLDLRVGQQNANSMMMTLGGRVAYTWNIAKNIALIPEARIFWQHEFLNNPRLIGAALDGGAGPAFNFQTSTPDRDNVFTGAGITAQFGETWNTFFFYNADFGSSDFVSHAISGGLGVKF